MPSCVLSTEIQKRMKPLPRQRGLTPKTTIKCHNCSSKCQVKLQNSYLWGYRNTFQSGTQDRQVLGSQSASRLSTCIEVFPKPCLQENIPGGSILPGVFFFLPFHNTFLSHSTKENRVFSFVF